MRKKRITHSTNTGAIADIAFLLLVFFMVVTTFNKDYSLTMNLPPYSDEKVSRPIDQERLIKISINGQNQIMIGSSVDIINPIEQITSHLRSILKQNKKPVILVHMHPEASYQQYISVVSFINHAKAKIKDEVSFNFFQTNYGDLDIQQKNKINNATKIQISEKQMELI